MQGTHITRRRGDTYADVFTLKKNRRAIDLTGYTFLLTVDPSAEPVDNTGNLYSITGVITDAVNGKVEFAPDAVEADQPPGTYYYDVQMIDTAGRIRTIEMGRYIYSQDITK